MVGRRYYGHFDEYYPAPSYQGTTDIYDFTVDYKSTEVSEFGEATYHFNDHWKATFGGRYYDIDLKTSIFSGVPGSDSTDQGQQKGQGFSPKGSITYEPSDNLLIYGLVSEGFRMGGVNLVPPLAGFATPATYGSDKLTNYEIGIRTSWFDHTLLVDVTPFYIDWKNVQIRLARPDGYDYVANAGGSHNFGVENTVTWRAGRNFDLTANVTYLDAALSQSLNLGNGTTLPNGAVLPGSSKWGTSETANYHFDLPFNPYIALTHRYVSSTLSAFQGGLPVGDWNTFDLRAGMTFGHVALTAFATNVTD